MNHAPLLGAMLIISAIAANAVTVWEADFEGAALGAASGNNQFLAGTSVETANSASCVVVDASTDPAAASAFTLASGQFIRLSVGDNDFAALRSEADPLAFSTVDDTDVLRFTADVYIPGDDDLDVSIGRLEPRLESNGAPGDGPSFDSAAVGMPGQYMLTYTGTVAEFKNPNSAGRANSARPILYFEQKADEIDDGYTDGFVYVDNIRLEINPVAGGGLFVGWGTPEYDDVAWPRGPGPIGYDTSVDDPYELGTNLSSMRGSQWSIYMRTQFELTAAQLAAVTDLELTVDYDDGYIAFLNGEEVSRGSTMGDVGTPFAFDDSSDGGHGATTDNGGTFDAPTITIDRSALRVGANVLAAQVHNSTINSSDLILYMELGDGATTLVPHDATYAYHVGSSEPEHRAALLPPHGVTLNPAESDQDGNGLPDIWEALYGATGADPDADSDGDGLTNVREAAFGTDPFDPHSAILSEITPLDTNVFNVSWSYLPQRPGTLQSSTDLGTGDPWIAVPGSPVFADGKWNLEVPPDSAANFFRLQSASVDRDSDGVPDWIEPLLGFSSAPGGADSVLRPQSYDTDGDSAPDVTLSGDLAAFNEIYRIPEAGESLTRAQAARLLLQTTFGPAGMAQVDYVAGIGAEAWIDEQIAHPPTLTRPYIESIKADLDAPPAGQWSSDTLSGYNINSPDSNPYVAGTNYMTAWMRSALRGPDQLRQRVGFALSQILVASRYGAMLGNQPRATAQYYDFMLEEAFGNYEDLLLRVSLSPFMGNYLSHIGNQKADPARGRYPDENYAREIMQLFTIGLWELNPDGTQKLDGDGEPIPTYNNLDITNVAKVFTGTNYASSNFGGGWRDDGDSGWMTTPMKVFASHHDFTSKHVPMGVDSSGGRVYHTIPARGASDANAMSDVKDLIYRLVRHPNCAPFVSRQLIQFLVTSNPTPAYVGRVASVFTDNGAGVTGDLEAVIRAILLDGEARNPLNHLKSAHFGHFREPTLRTVHLARVLKLGRHDQLLWWDWGYYREQSLQEPMGSPSVFNFYRPDFRLFGTLAGNRLDSPALGVVNSYSSISFTNYLWRICEEGFEQSGNAHRFWDNKVFPPDWGELEAMTNDDDLPALLDHLSILFCAGTLCAESRATITTVLQSEPASDRTDRARLAAFLVLISPEGTCLK